MTAGQQEDAIAHTTDQLTRLPFDHYARYALTQRVVALLRESRPQAAGLRILDIGGHSSPLKHFVPAESVVLLDVEPPGSLTGVELRYDEYVRGSGVRLPFADGAFDISTAHDTLEHIPPEGRRAFLREMLRVAGRFVVLNGPVFQQETRRAEERLAEYISNTLQWKQPFLAEHLELGLPERGLIEDVLREEAVPFVQLPNGTLALWLTLMALKHYLAAFSQTDVAREELDRIYNVLLFEHDLGGLCYREAYVCAKLAEDAEALQTVHRVLHGDTGREPAAVVGGTGPLGVLEGLLKALEQHAGLMRSEAQELHAALFSAEKKMFGVENDLDQHREALKDVQAELAKKEELLRESDAHEKELRRQVREIQNSMGYRALLFLRRGIRLTFPPDSIRGVPYRLARGLVRRVIPRNDG